MLAKIVGQVVEANKENVIGAVAKDTVAEKNGQQEMDVMEYLVGKISTYVS